MTYLLEPKFSGGEQFEHSGLFELLGCLELEERLGRRDVNGIIPLAVLPKSKFTPPAFGLAGGRTGLAISDLICKSGDRVVPRFGVERLTETTADACTGDRAEWLT